MSQHQGWALNHHTSIEIQPVICHQWKKKYAWKQRATTCCYIALNHSHLCCAV